ncbi:MAG: N-acetyl-gamma-glutamyl-phosphate reductase [Chloroflexota bacterium]|nr:N-acetyl-gamma-glutamyl-phosphate reductase [Chloroflexota bacterium]
MTRVGIINVTGYIGMEIARLLHGHPQVELVSVTGRSAAGQKLGEFLPHLSDIDLIIEPELGDVDLAFSALPHKESAVACAQALERGIKVIDVSADFRLKDASKYQEWYDFTHPAPKLLGEAVYGLVELHRDRIPSSRLVANPGCYPTGAILALAPAVKAGIVEPDVIVDSKSGVSGAGRALNLKVHFAEANENASAYALDGHRHLPEMVQELDALNSKLSISATFVPHLIPMNRGILSTCYARLADGAIDKKKIVDLYKEFYKGERFVKVVDVPPQTKQTLGTNLCLIHPAVEPRTGRLIVISCIDNLVKGGAGQAIQNMNLMLGFDESVALGSLAVYP